MFVLQNDHKSDSKRGHKVDMVSHKTLCNAKLANAKFVSAVFVCIAEMNCGVESSLVSVGGKLKTGCSLNAGILQFDKSLLTCHFTN